MSGGLYFIVAKLLLQLKLAQWIAMIRDRHWENDRLGTDDALVNFWLVTDAVPLRLSPGPNVNWA